MADLDWPSRERRGAGPACAGANGPGPGTAGRAAGQRGSGTERQFVEGWAARSSHCPPAPRPRCTFLPGRGCRGRREDWPSLDLYPSRIPRCGGAGAGIHPGRRHLPGQSLPTVSVPVRRGSFPALPKTPAPEPRAVRRLSRIRRGWRSSAPRPSVSSAWTRTAGASRLGRSREPGPAGWGPCTMPRWAVPWPRARRTGRRT